MSPTAVPFLLVWCTKPFISTNRFSLHHKQKPASHTTTPSSSRFALNPKSSSTLSRQSMPCHFNISFPPTRFLWYCCKAAGQSLNWHSRPIYSHSQSFRMPFLFSFCDVFCPIITLFWSFCCFTMILGVFENLSETYCVIMYHYILFLQVQCQINFHMHTKPHSMN